MSAFEKFQFRSLEDFKEKISELDLDMIVEEDLSYLQKEVKLEGCTAPNAMAILPMEGCDGNRDGSPSLLTQRRYRRFASGGAGLLWFEACAIVPEGRANPLQLWIHKDNLQTFSKLTEICRNEAQTSYGGRPVMILQLTHSGRYARPVDNGAPMIPVHDPLLDEKVGITGNYPVITDSYLDRLQDKYVEAALLAKSAGFDGVDIKACHRYLVSELLSARTRKGKYGGSFENRSRFLLETVRKVKAAVGKDFVVACRFNVFDAHPYPYGFGVDQEYEWKPDLTEPLELVRQLIKAGVGLLSNSAGNPYYRFPQVTRPFDQPIIGGESPDEHPLESVSRLIGFTKEIQKAAKNVPVIGNGYSWLREYLPYVGAANLKNGNCSMVGLGRQAFAYPSAPLDIMQKGKMEAMRCCITCSKCTQIMRDHGKTGCVIRDAACYLPLYKEARVPTGE